MDTPPDSDASSLTRAERRARTRATILDAARRTFAENGYERATIRAVAERARCDPALVMQHFGNKRALFQEATSIDLDVRALVDTNEGVTAEQILRETFERLDRNREAVTSTLRAMLTHDTSADEALKLFNPPPANEVAAPWLLSEFGHELATAFILGTAITRYVLAEPAVASATPEDLASRLLPALEALGASQVSGP